MKNIILDKAYNIISEPGDATRYKYLFYPNCGMYYFISLTGLRYPDYLDDYMIDGIKTTSPCEKAIELAKTKNCNPWTLIECIRTIREYQEDKLLRIEGGLI